jgi:hypothetical protein
MLGASGKMCGMSPDPRAVVEYRVPAVDLHIGDLIDTGEGDWQQVLGVYTDADDVADAELRALAETVAGRYVVVQLTDISPLDNDVYFAGGLAMTYGTEDGADQAVKDAVSSEDGVRTYLYTRYEVVTVRGSAG